MFLIASCSSDDDGSTALPEDVIPGTWEVIESESVFDVAVPGLATTKTISEGRDFEGEITFTEDPNVWVSNIGGTYDLTIMVTVGGQTDTEEDTEVIPQEEQTGNWSINSDGQLEGFLFEIPTDEDVDVEDLSRFDVQVVNDNRIILTSSIDTTINDMSTGFTFNIAGSSQAVLNRK